MSAADFSMYSSLPLTIAAIESSLMSSCIFGRPGRWSSMHCAGLWYAKTQAR